MMDQENISDTDSREREHGIYKVTLVGSATNLFLLVFKFIAGIFGNSAAMIADAIHSLSDFITDLIVLVFVRLSIKPVDKSHDYGHGKFETLATAIIGIVLFVVGIGIFWSGVSSVAFFLKGGTLEQPGMIAFIAALFSVISKEVLYRYTVRKADDYNSRALIANAWHHRSDAFSSIATMVGIGAAVLLGSKWTVMDPIAAVLVSFLIMKVAIDLLIPCVEELLEKSLPEEIEKEIEEIVLSFPGTSNVHNLRTRRIGNNYAIELHVRMNGDIPLNEAHRVATEIEEKLRETYGGNTHIGIHLEPLK